jgi:hypothetical protein
MRRLTCNDPPLGYKREAKIVESDVDQERGRSAAEIPSELLLDRAGRTLEAASVPRDARVLPADPYPAADGNRVSLVPRLEPTVL